METAERIKSFLRGRKHSTLIAVCGTAGLLLIMLSSVIPEKRGGKTEYKVKNSSFGEAEAYCRETEERLGDFLSDIEGAGEVKVFLTVAGDQRSVYAKEKRRSFSENKNEEEEKYVLNVCIAITKKASMNFAISTAARFSLLTAAIFFFAIPCPP